MHTGGEPVRIAACAGTVAAYPPIPGTSAPTAPTSPIL
jgi:hypothetical protein